MTAVPAPLHVLMICAHEPGLDPRIRWEAEAAASRFSVTVLGFNRDDGSLPNPQSDAGYRVVRRQRNSVSGIYYFWRLRAVVPQALHIPLGALLLLMSPVLICGELLGRLLRGAMRRVAHAPTVSAPLQTVRFSKFLGRLRGRWRVADKTRPG